MWFPSAQPAAFKSQKKTEYSGGSNFSQKLHENDKKKLDPKEAHVHGASLDPPME